MIKHAFERGHRDALRKFALAPPTQVDQFVADVETGKDVAPAHDMTPALDGSMPIAQPPSFPAAPPAMPTAPIGG